MLANLFDIELWITNISTVWFHEIGQFLCQYAELGVQKNLIAKLFFCDVYWHNKRSPKWNFGIIIFTTFWSEPKILILSFDFLRSSIWDLDPALPKCDFAKFPWISFDFPLISFDFGDFLDYHRLSLILSQSKSRSQIEDRRKSRLKIKIFRSDQNVVKIMIPKFHLRIRSLRQTQQRKKNLQNRYFLTPKVGVLTHI